MADADDTVIPLDVWAGWVERACQINEYAPAVREWTPADRGRAGGPSEDAPGTDFNRRGSWAEAGLFDCGWTVVRKSGDDQGLVCRPDKDRGVSASVGTVTSRENGWPLFWCWSTSVPQFVAEQPYTRFAVFAILRHGGDYSAAAKDLAARGYGRRQPDVVLPEPAAAGADRPDGPADPDRIFRWMSELRVRPANDKWLWHGYLSRGGVTLLNALWKAGKSTLLSHLLRSLDGRTTEFLGRELTPGRVLYVSEEHEDLWAERRDELGIGDHVGIITRDQLPFRGRASPADWAAFIGKLVGAVRDQRFDLVVIDTISKLWPVREENDAGQVEDALMPMWNVTNTGAALLLVHHNRKSGGKDFTAGRGSGGLPAFCETLIEFERHSDDTRDCRRLLTAAGRFKETPAKWLVELTPAGYRSLGDPTDGPEPVIPAARDWKSFLDDAVPEGGNGATITDIQDALAQNRFGVGVRRKDLLETLNQRVEGGEYQRLGLGSKGSPFRWYRVVMDSRPASQSLDLSGEHESGTESD